MKNAKTRLMLLLLLAGLSGTALAGHRQHFHHGSFVVGSHGHFHHRGTHVGIAISGPLWMPWYYPSYPTYPSAYYYSAPYPYPYFYGYAYPYSSAISIASAAPTYVERQGAADPQSSSPANYWYYCHNPEGYYPDVKQCRSAWQKVPPIPPSSR